MDQVLSVDRDAREAARKARLEFEKVFFKFLVKPINSL